MATTGAAKAKTKANYTPAAPPTVIDVEDGLPNKETSYVALEGTVQFNNRDATGYRIRLWVGKREKHPFIDVLLPGVAGVTLMADPLAKGNEECAFDLIPTSLKHPSKGEDVATGGGGKIIIGPTPVPPRGKR
jgi:hypothetical protein